ncbi:MAG: hypothetical protein V1798_04305, partial [Pseudomonadota bacterium]
MKGFAGAVRSKAVVAMAIALLVVAILFYSSPVAAYWINSAVSPTVSRQAGGSQLNVTITIGKVTDEVLSNYSDVTAMLMYQNSTKSDAVSASNCSVTSVGFTQGYTFHGYGYMRDLYEGYGYGYLGGYGIGETSMACLFSFTIPSGAVVVGMDNVTVNGVTLGNSSASMYGSTFIQFASNQVYSYKTITAGGPADSYSFSRYNETRPVMNVTIPASITVNGTGSGTFGMSLDIIPPLGEVLTKTQGPVFLMGPSGTTFS